MSTAASGNGKVNRPDRRSDQRIPVVYFLALSLPSADRPHRIKIGESENFSKRLAQHEKEAARHGSQVSALCVIRGRRDDEQHLHRFFASHLVEGQDEHFWPHPDLVGYIRWLRDQHYAWVPDCSQCPPLEQMEQVDASAWMPLLDRTKARPPLIQRQLFDRPDTVLDDLGLPPREVTTDDFYTDGRIIEAARAAMGAINLDPASHAIANRVVCAERFYTVRDDGLTKPWHGCVWLNPPFSQWQSWVPKILHEWQSGQVQALCVLCATRTLTAHYFVPMHKNCSAWCVMHGRIPFWGGRAAAPDDGHAVFYFGHDAPAFRQAFDEIGTTYTRA